MHQTIYLDNAATTAVYPEVIEYMLPFFDTAYANPMGSYELGRLARNAVEHARANIAGCLNAYSDEIYFTSGGTESDNWILRSTARLLCAKGKHIIASGIEHNAILHPLDTLSDEGYDITYLPCDRYGNIDPDTLEKAIRPDTILVSIMAANNEIGTIEPIRELGAIAHSRGVLFHTDAVQAFGHIPIDVRTQNIDYLSVSSHKFGGPKGIGFLYARRDCPLAPFIEGGSQENNMRAGTQNVPAIAGMGLAANISCRNLQYKMRTVSALRDHMIHRLRETIPDCYLNGPDCFHDHHVNRLPNAINTNRLPNNINTNRLPNNINTNRLPNNISVTFPGHNAATLLARLNDYGICASAGSACHSGSSSPSHVLTAIGLDKADALSTIRFTLGRDTTMADLDYTVNVLRRIVQ